MRVLLLVLAIAVTGSLFAGCGRAETEEERAARYAAMTPMERTVQEVLDMRCLKCHMPPDPEGKILLNHPKYLIPLLNSDKLFDDLAMYKMLLGDTTISDHRRGESRITFEEVAMIRDWVLTEHSEIMMPDTTAPDTTSPGSAIERKRHSALALSTDR